MPKRTNDLTEFAKPANKSEPRITIHELRPTSHENVDPKEYGEAQRELGITEQKLEQIEKEKQRIENEKQEYEEIVNVYRTKDKEKSAILIHADQTSSGQGLKSILLDRTGKDISIKRFNNVLTVIFNLCQ